MVVVRGEQMAQHEGIFRLKGEMEEVANIMDRLVK
jgi:hypothetical protein